ncbi:MAG: ABC transporter C-terminal domain-containing protein, partial [Sphingomonadales bacterium]
EYAGGFSDYLRQRRSVGISDQQQTGQKKSATPKRGQPKSSSRLSFKHKHRLKVLADEMDAARKRLAALERALGDPGFYDRDAKAFEAASEGLARTQAMLAALEDEWLELEILREDAEG